MGGLARTVVLLGCGAILSACSSSGISDYLSLPGGQTALQLNSEPAGALATTSMGASCRTPCSLQVATTNEFSVTFALDGYQPQTVPVRVHAADNVFGSATVSPNPLLAQLQAVPPPAAKKRKAPRHTVAVHRPTTSAAAPPPGMAPMAPPPPAATPWPASPPPGQ